MTGTYAAMGNLATGLKWTICIPTATYLEIPEGQIRVLASLELAYTYFEDGNALVGLRDGKGVLTKRALPADEPDLELEPELEPELDDGGMLRCTKLIRGKVCDGEGSCISRLRRVFYV